MRADDHVDPLVIAMLTAVDECQHSTGIPATSQEHRPTTRTTEDSSCVAPTDTDLPRLTAGRLHSLTLTRTLILGPHSQSFL